MDIKRLHEAIKQLREELDRVDLAIQRIEVIAEAVVHRQQADGESFNLKPETAGPADEVN